MKFLQANTAQGFWADPDGDQAGAVRRERRFGYAVDGLRPERGHNPLVQYRDMTGSLRQDIIAGADTHAHYGQIVSCLVHNRSVDGDLSACVPGR
jgi:hypothetical protein